MTGKARPPVAGELEDALGAAYIQDTVKKIGGVAHKLWVVGTNKAKDLYEEGTINGTQWMNSSAALPTEEEEEGDAFHSFEDLDMLESGFAREYVSDECLRPHQSTRRWMTCSVIKEEKTMFRMYVDGGDQQLRFLLAAKRIGDAFYISQYEAFPESVEEDPVCYYCAVLRCCSGGHFKLFLNGCENCDMHTDKFTCGGGQSKDRQLLAEIHHSVKRVKAANADMRCLNVKLPQVDANDRKTRDVWCPRIEQARRHRDIDEKFDGDSLVNKLPEWNNELQSLVLRFNKGRVLAPSAKNFLLCPQNVDNKEGVLQFGKTRRRRYALDFRYPMSPLQAFGICLSLFNWTV